MGDRMVELHDGAVVADEDEVISAPAPAAG
jgi:DNA integrity scanning protein DisA with diadenylate cyclase activity